MSKATISYDELLKKVQKIVADQKECRNIHIDSIKVFPQDVSGANWDITSIRRSGDDNDIEECKEVIMAEIQALRMKFDVTK